MEREFGWLGVPKDWIASLGDIIKFCGRAFGDIFNGRVLHFFGETLRQAGILVLGSALVIWGMVFILGLECGIEGAYLQRAVGAPAYAGVFSAWCDLREMVPYMFGYIMSAKVGTGIVAELGAMRINEEIDALEVIGVRPITFLAATRLLGAWIVLPFVYLSAVGVGFYASYLAVVVSDCGSLVRWLLAHLLDVPEPARPALQRDQGNGNGDRDRRGWLLLRLQSIGRGRSVSAERPPSR